MEHYIVKSDIQLYNTRETTGPIRIRNLKCNTENFVRTFGVDVSDVEKDWFSANVAAWAHFHKNSSEAFCLITEEGVELQAGLDEMDAALREMSTPWDVLFPYDKIHHETGNLPLSISRFGFFWGTYSYFIHRDAVADLLRICRYITAPLDEVLVARGLKKGIKLLCLETDWFRFDQSTSISFVARKQTVIDYVDNYVAWSEEEIEEVRTIMQYLSAVAAEVDVKIFLHAGTLLGAVRHGKIMDWDDDVDLMIDKRDSKALIDRIASDKKYNITPWIWKTTGKAYYKVWKPGGYKVEGFEYTFPFVDIWVVETDKETNYAFTNDGYEFHYDTYYPLVKTSFEGVAFYLPNKGVDILHRMYKRWREEIKIFSWSHKLKKHSVRQMTVFIETDETGRFKNYK